MPPTGEILLRLRDWSLARRSPGGGEAPILTGIDLELRAGRWLAVLGANGSGKSSLLKFLAADDSPLTAQRAIMFQDPDDQIISATVARELTLGRPETAAGPLLDAFGLAGLGEMDPRLLSAGQKQRLVLAVALGAGPQVLFCDEPTALQDGHQAAWVLDCLDRWRRETGAALVTATCDRREVRRADDLLVLQEGRVALAGPVDQLLDHPLLADLLGPDAEAGTSSPGPPASPHREDATLVLQGVGCDLIGPGGGFGGVDLTVAAGARVGISGPNGCGKSTLLAACVGARPPDRGRIRVAGRNLYPGKGCDLDHGLALLAPQFPEYLFTRATVTEEVALDPCLQGQVGLDLPTIMGLPADSAARNPHSLSSGQKRRLALGLVLFSGRPLLLLDEPTAALDREGRRLVLDLLDQVPPATALVIASHDRDFLRQAGCRCLVLGPDGLA